MKKEYVYEILILLFLLLCASLISFWAYKVHFVDKNTHTLYFEDVDGIVTGSPVKFMGVVVGHVSSLQYKNGSINVKILITKKGITFPKGSTANVQFTGIAGSKSIEIVPPKEGSIPYEIIMTENPLRVKDLFEFSKSYTNALLSIENQLELISYQSIYKIFEKTMVPYDWSYIDNILENTSNNLKADSKYVKGVVNKEKKITGEVEKINNLIPKR